MGKLYSELVPPLREFIAAQQVFFVATAPSGASGHVNLSPKGLDSFRILGPTRVAYLDCVGSGAETLAHLRENGRICVMFCAFAGAPKILRLQGLGRALEAPDPEFAELRGLFPSALPARSIVSIELSRIADSCGYGVPLYELRGERSQLGDWAERMGAEALDAYQREKNARSIDGLPALRWVARAGERAE